MESFYKFYEQNQFFISLRFVGEYFVRQAEGFKYFSQ